MDVHDHVDSPTTQNHNNTNNHNANNQNNNNQQKKNPTLDQSSTLSSSCLKPQCSSCFSSCISKQLEILESFDETIPLVKEQDQTYKWQTHTTP